jgi:Spy/CpxP family protein refolding chaperone
MTRWVLAAVAAAMLATAPLAAQDRPGGEAFARAVFDPQLVLRHARDIGLTAAQRRAILDELRAAQTALAPLQVDMTEPALELIELLDQARPDEAKVLARTEQVLRIENQVKLRQTALLVRVKNVLTPEQQARLRALRDGAGRGGAPERP